MAQCICIDVDEGYDDCAAFELVSTGDMKCCECGAVIPNGEKYQHEDCYEMDDQDEYRLVDSYDTCCICTKIRGDYFDCGWYYGRMWEDLEDFLDSDETCHDHRIVA